MSTRNSFGRTLPLILLLAACSAGKAPVPADTPTAGTESAPGTAPAAEDLVKLDADQVRKLGLQVTPAVAAHFNEETEGYAQVWSHETIAQAVAELSAAEASLRQSAAAFERIHRLADTPGAFPAENGEAAQRQQAADQATLLLAQRKLSALLGDHPPFNQTGVSLADLASGRTKLVRITFPIGSHAEQGSRSVRLLPLDAVAADKGWTAAATWTAPADNGVPGQSLWAAVTASGLVEGDRLTARMSKGSALPGVLVPDAAVVVSEDHYWCFIEKPEGTFRKMAVDTSHPVAGGYVIATGVAAGERIVTRGAGLLLARATNAAGSDE